MPHPVSDDLIVAAEQELGRRFPEAMRARLRAENGGEIMVDREAWFLHPVWDPSSKATIRKTTSHIVHETREARESWPGFVGDAIAVANDGAGNYLVLRPGHDELEEWCHEGAELTAVGSVDWTARTDTGRR